MLKGVFLFSPEVVFNQNQVKSNNKIKNSKKYLIFLHNMVLLIYVLGLAFGYLCVK